MHAEKLLLKARTSLENQRQAETAEAGPSLHEYQKPPQSPWSTWLLLGGRGAGKTRAGAAWLLGQAGRGKVLALVGPTLHDVREVMIGGPSGILALAAPNNRPHYEISRRRLVWDDGCVAYAFSAEDPDSLRGPQFHAAWADEFCAWAHPAQTLAMLRLGLRRGTDPQLVVTTTPRPIKALRRMLEEPGLIPVQAATAQNAMNLAPSFLTNLNALYGGTRLAAQELEGLVVEDEAGALWRAQTLSGCRGAAPEDFERVVVAIDPPAGTTGSACGIVAAGLSAGRGYVLADRSARGMTPDQWARRAMALAREVGADAIVAEANQGGAMVAAVLETARGEAGAGPPIRLVHARVGKRARAEPVAALYEQGKVTHCGLMRDLEEEMMALGSQDAEGTADRVDALVWALSDLMVGRREGPRISVL